MDKDLKREEIRKFLEKYKEYIIGIEYANSIEGNSMKITIDFDAVDESIMDNIEFSLLFINTRCSENMHIVYEKRTKEKMWMN